MSQEWRMPPVSLPLNPRTNAPLKRAVTAGTTTFQAELNKQLRAPSVTFSAHALERLRVRNIRLNQEDLTRLSNAVDRVAGKGGRESLVVYRDTAFVISIKNRTVITAMDTAHMKDHVFTQIDSAVFA